MAATYELISGQTFTSNSSSCTFNSFSGYTDLVIQANFAAAGASTPWDCYVRFNSDSSGNYDGLAANNTQSGTFDNTSFTSVPGVPIIGAYNSPINATHSAHFELTIPEYTDSSKRKHGSGTYSYIADESSGRSNTGWLVWNWKNTNAITSITVIITNGNFRGTINLYGITAGNA